MKKLVDSEFVKTCHEYVIGCEESAIFFANLAYIPNTRQNYSTFPTVWPEPIGIEMKRAGDKYYRSWK